MKTYTITQARQLLNVDNKTFSRWLARADIIPQPSQHDERIKRITEEQLHQLASIHERPLGTLPVEREVHPTVKALQKRQEALERTVARLAEQVTKLEAVLQITSEQLAQLTAQPAPLPNRPAAQKQPSAPQPLPSPGGGLVPAMQFALTHGVRKAAAHTAFKRQTIPTTKRHGDTTHYLTDEQQEAALAYWDEHQTPGFQPCPDPECRCHK